ncbi:MAG: fibronectin type III domain-containing protein [Candidatus Staskawiczbacteria bacterium]|nr:fibronectin type III domain-containing protein [Candidatus Staskawiczbacteria bacterium]
MNHKKIILSIVLFNVFSFLFVPMGPAVNAQTMASTETQILIAQLTKQIAQLQVQMIQLQDQQGTWCHTFNTDLKIGDSRTEISSLALALEKENIYVRQGENLPDVFDQTIFSKVITFQEKYASEILTPYRLVRGTGYVGNFTRIKLNKIYGCETISPPAQKSTITQPSTTALPSAITDSQTVQTQQSEAVPPSAVTDNSVNSNTNSAIISHVTVSSITSTGASISWTTTEARKTAITFGSRDKLGDTQVEYGTTTSYGKSTILNTSMVRNHSQELSGLTPNTLYHFRVKSRDEEGNLSVSQDFTFTTLDFSVYSTGLDVEISYQIDNRIAGLTADSSTKNLFTTRGDATSPWVRNSSVWTERGDKALDLTGASPWVSYGNYAKGGTLISPRHIVFANHASIINGATIIFVDKNNNIITRTLQNQQRVGSSDIEIGVLDSDVPSSIAYYPVIAYDEMLQYLSSTNNSSWLTFTPRIPTLVLDQEDHAIIQETPAASPLFTYFASPQAGTARMGFWESFVSGDSGNPGFFTINNKLALIITLYSNGSGYNCGSYISELNQAMTNLGGGYQVKRVDLSNFVKKWP